MTSERLRRMIRSRWWVLALASLLSIVASVLVIQSRNDAIPDYEAVAAITFNRLLGEPDDTLAQGRLANAEGIAISVNSSYLDRGVDPLSPEARADIVSSDRDLRLRFIGRGASAEQATEVATTMRDRYLAAQQLDSSQELAQRIADTADKHREVVAAIAAKNLPPDVGDVESASRLRELQAEVDAYAALYGDLTAELLNPRVPPRPQATITAARDEASQGLRAAQDELLQLQFEQGSPAADDSELAVLQAQEVQLRTALDAFIAQSIVEEPIGVPDAVTVEETAIPRTPLPMAIVIGLVIGILVGIVGLVFVDRIRKPLWEPTELEPRYRLPEVAARPRSYGDQATRPWYETAPQGQRKVGIQQLRSHVEGLPGFGQGLVVGLASLAGSSPNVHELAADLAAGITSSGSWAVLIDADYGNPSDLPEFSTTGLELEEVVGDPRKLLGEAVGRTDREKELVGVSIANRDPDAADLLAQPAFASMLDAAQELNDVVIVACPPTDSASYHVLSQRLDAMILVAVPGDLVPADVVNALHTLDERRAHAAGVVLVQPRVGPISLITRGLEQTASRPTQGASVEPDWHWSVEADRLGVASEYPPASPSEPDQNGEPSTAGTREVQKAPTRTARITRRATALKAASTTPVEKPHTSVSPWSFRHEGDDASGDGEGERPTE